ncbi:MAG: hypothetical protein DRG20_05155 [Deltaproteobacteria bacterium]|nr:hypothetical protein [Deltaproteobacteria bacterium]RLA89115.1 MAG: hypothetical protein DRG20_05155 [Deltaproteobacteria bacterium]
MEIKEKLIRIIEHWIDHNEEHLLEYKRWADIAIANNFKDVDKAIKIATEKVREANEELQKALSFLEPS